MLKLRAASAGFFSQIWDNKLKATTIFAAKGLHALAQLVEKVIYFIIEKTKKIINSDSVKTLKNKTVEKTTLLIDNIKFLALASYNNLIANRK